MKLSHSKTGRCNEFPNRSETYNRRIHQDFTVQKKIGPAPKHGPYPRGPMKLINHQPSGRGDLNLTGSNLFCFWQCDRQNTILMTGSNPIGTDRTMDGQLALKPSERPFLVATNILLFVNLGLPLTGDDEDSIVERDLDIFAPNSWEIDQDCHGVGNLKHIQIGAETGVEI